MTTVKTLRVEVKRDHLIRIASCNAEAAIAEMIWNALDADATEVNVNFYEGPLQAIEKIVISDNGTGIPYGDAQNLFVALGGSWKVQKQRTEQGRFLHGRDGEGRFKAFALGKRVAWSIVYETNGKLRKYIIEGNSDSLDEFVISDEETITGAHTGVTVSITQVLKKSHVMEDENRASERLMPIFALYLSNYPSVVLRVGNTKIDPEKAIKNKQIFLLSPIEDSGEQYPIELELVEWRELRDHHELLFCNEYGFALERYNRQIRGVADFSFSAYLKSRFFGKQQISGRLQIADLDKQLQGPWDEAVAKIKEYFLKRALENARDQLSKWKEEEVYPYKAEPRTPVEKVERQVFDIVAININQNLPSFEDADKKTKAFQFRMLRQAIEKSPEELQTIITEILQLPKDKRDRLSELLRNVSLVGIINASGIITDRLRFLLGLEQMLFDADLQKHFKERSQLHRILAQNTWVFGDAFSLSVDDRSLTEVLKKHLKLASVDMPVNEPVKRLDGRPGIVDLMLSRSIPRNHSDELEHLVIELKAPKVDIGQKEIEQVKSYAYAVARDERFKGIHTRWNFWVVSNDLTDYAQLELSQVQHEKGVIYKSAVPLDLTIWIKTWSQLLQENKHRLEFIKEKLNYTIDAEEALEYLKKTYSELTDSVLPSEDPKDNGAGVLAANKARRRRARGTTLGK